MILTRKQKSIFLLCIVASFLLVIIFSIKGKNSPRSKFFEAYDWTITHVSMECQHDWYGLTDFFHGYGHENEKHMGWVTDIHADVFKRRTLGNGTLYPRKYSEYLPKVFDDMRKRGILTVLVSGDNVNSGDVSYAEDLARIAYSKNMRVLWVKGNHDSDGSMRKLGLAGNEFYYYQDFGDTRLIVLDDTQYKEDEGNWTVGGINQEQIDWLIASLKTNKKVIISMHIPIFPKTLEQVVLPEYTEFEKIIHESGNVKLVLSGHLHIKWEKQFDGIEYYGESALTREGEQGGYGIIDLSDMSVNHYQAK